VHDFEPFYRELVRRIEAMAPKDAELVRGRQIEAHTVRLKGHNVEYD
jgi:hypothetical protein